MQKLFTKNPEIHRRTQATYRTEWRRKEKDPSSARKKTHAKQEKLYERNENILSLFPGSSIEWKECPKSKGVGWFQMELSLVQLDDLEIGQESIAWSDLSWRGKLRKLFEIDSSFPRSKIKREYSRWSFFEPLKTQEKPCLVEALPCGLERLINLNLFCDTILRVKVEAGTTFTILSP